jgi:branched-subunit amino acid aminotransferase/4-amino-4-deoxychorismate lyase
MIRSLDQHLEHLEEEIAFLKRKIEDKELWIDILNKKLVDKNNYIDKQRVIIAGYTK